MTARCVPLLRVVGVVLGMLALRVRGVRSQPHARAGVWSRSQQSGACILALVAAWGAATLGCSRE